MSDEQLFEEIVYFDEHMSIPWKSEQNKKAFEYLEKILSTIENKKLPENLAYYKDYFTKILTLNKNSPVNLTKIQGYQINPHLLKFINGLKISFKNPATKPFLVLFHRSNHKEYVNKILEMQYRLPEYYLGRTIEFAFETDFFWIEHHGKVSTFLGHAVHGWIPRKAKKIWKMRKGEGLLLPKWLFSRIGKINLCVEVKSGWGTEPKALDELIELIKRYNLQDNVNFYCFSVWIQKYLKERLPKCFNILICLKGLIPGRFMQFPLNRPFSSLWKWGPFVSVKNVQFVDSLAIPAKKTEKKIQKQINWAQKNNKEHFAGRVKTKEQFDWLVQNGSRGCMVWVSPQELFQWLTSR